MTRPGFSGAPGGPLVFLLGPTASGKTRLALELLHRGALGPMAVVGCDSMQVYRHLDIGTAKPTPEERRVLHHHLVDVLEPTDAFNAGDYVRLADRAIADERARGRLPLVVGGTGLYVRALLHGLAEVPAVPAAIRERLAERLAAEGLAALRTRLEEVDPALHARLEPLDTQRILRGLEVHEATGTPLSALQAAHRFQAMRYEPLLLALAVQREMLYARIERRIDEMLDAGLVDEVRAVLERGGPADCRPLQAPGYREVVAHLRGELSRDAMIEQIRRAHRRYAKRQMTWFKAVRGVEWVEPEAVASVEERILRFVES